LPMIRKIIRFGSSRVVSIPKTWLDYYEQKYGSEIDAVLLEVDQELKIWPYIPDREKTRQKKEGEK